MSSIDERDVSSNNVIETERAEKSQQQKSQLSHTRQVRFQVPPFHSAIKKQRDRKKESSSAAEVQRLTALCETLRESNRKSSEELAKTIAQLAQLHGVIAQQHYGVIAQQHYGVNVQLRGEITRLNGEITQLSGINAQLHGVIAQLQDERSKSVVENAALNHRLEEAEATISSLREELKKLKSSSDVSMQSAGPPETSYQQQ